MAAAFFATTFLAGAFLAAAFFATGAFLAAAFFATTFLAGAFLAADGFLVGALPLFVLFAAISISSRSPPRGRSSTGPVAGGRRIVPVDYPIRWDRAGGQEPSSAKKASMSPSSPSTPPPMGATG